ncbi:WD40-repeat-containing domain protein [Polychytrium aggregatum]|uniref:WD40-repeat-containing domain protein n=1 Tax=Polychytrium aggregatum TaxID=110093 RepID=UPI0022FF3D04|nr:WD40-repeat-containing domain protein [Polychytrium aggregatum]KAI9193091.1 WD40-repeat-containing domain protein [Polychytrium aggregatum]
MSPTKLPFHKIVHHPSQPFLLLCYGNKFDIVSTDSGSIRAAPQSRFGPTTSSPTTLSKTHPIPDHLFAKDDIRVAAFHTDRLVTGGDEKSLSIWNTDTWEVLDNSRQFVKRPNAVTFSKDGSYVLGGDKAGDVYSFHTHETSEKRSLLLGHVSIILDLALSPCGKYIITADRDEKIRVTHYPHSYDIQSFCLGHNEFVSTIAIPAWAPKTLLSGGGDPYLIAWNYVHGEQLYTVDLRAPLARADENMDATADLTVLAIRTCPKTHHIAVLIEKQKHVLIFDGKNAAAGITLNTIIPIDVDALDIVFDHSGHLWISKSPLNNPSGRLIDIARCSAEGVLQAPVPDDPLTIKINRVSVHPTVENEAELDLYPISQHRKSIISGLKQGRPKPPPVKRTRLADSLPGGSSGSPERKKVSRGGQRARAAKLVKQSQDQQHEPTEEENDGVAEGDE